MITIPLNNHYALINGAQKSLDVPAKSVNGRTLVPLRFVGESLGCEVAWDSKRHLVTIKQIVRANELPPEETIPVTDTTIVPEVPGEIVPSDKPLFD